MWFPFALSAAFIYAFRGIFEKKLIHNVNKYVLGLAVRLFAMPFFLIPFLFNPEIGIPVQNLNREFWIGVLTVSFILTPFEIYFYYEALKEDEVSLLLPILSLTPVTAVFFGFIFLRDIPSILGVIGILSIIFGIYSLKIGHAREGILQPFLHLKNSRGIRLMFIVMLSQSLGSIFDRIGVTNSNAFLYSLINYILVSVSLFVLAYINAKQHLGQLIQQSKHFIIIGIIVAGYTLFYMSALSTGQAAYVQAIKSSSLLVTIFLGHFFLKEKDLRAKLLAAFLILIGLILIKVFG